MYVHTAAHRYASASAWCEVHRVRPESHRRVLGRPFQRTRATSEYIHVLRVQQCQEVRMVVPKREGANLSETVEQHIAIDICNVAACAVFYVVHLQINIGCCSAVPQAAVSVNL